MIRFRFLTSIVLLFQLLHVGHSFAKDFDGCQDALENLRKRTTDAADAAEEGKSNLEEFENCTRDPQMYDLTGDHCQSRKADYDSASDELDAAMDEVDESLSAVQDSCTYQFTMNSRTSLEASQRHLDASRQRLCNSYHRLSGLGVSSSSILQTCARTEDEKWCKTCLGMK